MTEKICLTKSAFTQLININRKLAAHDYSAALRIYLSLFDDGNISSILAYTIAKCYLNLSDFSSAEKWVTKAIAIDPVDKYYLFLAQLNEFKYNYENAIKIYRAFLQDHPNNEQALHNLFMFYTEPGGEKYIDKQYAKECLIKLIDMNKDQNLSFYCFELAKIEYSNGEFSVAEELLNKAVINMEPLAEMLLKHIEELMEKIWSKKR